MTDFGITDDLSALRQIFDPTDLKLIDVGCGAGTLTRQLAETGARVVGVEPDVVQADINSQSSIPENLEFHCRPANDLPVEPNSVDGVIFSYSLHHVPRNEVQSSLEAAISVLNENGFLLVMEPMLEGSFNHAIELFHDETAVRLNAIESLKQFALPNFQSWKQFFYTTETRFMNFEAFCEYFVNMSYNQFDENIIRSDAVRERFELNLEGDDYVLRDPVRVDFYTECD